METNTGDPKIYTVENLADVNREELVKIILEQQSKLKDGNNTNAHRKRKHELISTSPSDGAQSVPQAEEGAKRRKVKQDRPFDWSKYSKRHVALKVAYLGWDYLGLVVQKNASPTIEEKVIEALKRTKLIEDASTCNYSRCGRTDKGVSAFGQVISVTLRSNCSTGVGIVSKGTVEHEGPEIDYTTMLNHHLPDDIRILSWCPVPVDFDARFACSWRLYRYFFVRDRLNIEAMREAAQHLVGEHDFRNFCKMDAQNVHNYVRTILSFEIEPQDDGRDINDEKKMFAFVIKGRAFLWHQVRCMTSILFLVGQGKEKPHVVADMLDLTKFVRKPVYAIASEIPLVLYDSGYADGVIQWKNEPETHLGLWKHFLRMWEERCIRGTIVTSMLRTLTEDDLVVSSSGSSESSLVPWTQIRDITPDKRALQEKYTALALRDTETSYEEKIEGIMARLERTGKTHELERIKKILAEKASGALVADSEDFGE